MKHYILNSICRTNFKHSWALSCQIFEQRISGFIQHRNNPENLYKPVDLIQLSNSSYSSLKRTITVTMSDENKKRKSEDASSDAPKAKKSSEAGASGGGGGEDFLERIKKRRLEVCSSVAKFKFNKKRVRVLSKAEDFPDDSKGVVYWMSRDQRVQGILF